MNDTQNEQRRLAECKNAKGFYVKKISSKHFLQGHEKAIKCDICVSIRDFSSLFRHAFLVSFPDIFAVGTRVHQVYR